MSNSHKITMSTLNNFDNNSDNSTQNEDELTLLKNNEEFSTKRTLWDRIPKYKWWVTPLNILFICIFLFIIDLVTLPNTSFINIDWAWWPIGGLVFAYLVSFILFKRPEIAWIVGPILMVGTSILLLAIDYAFGPNDGFLKLDWAIIPVTALFTFGVLIPIITKFGRKKEKPLERFREAIAEMKKQESELDE